MEILNPQIAEYLDEMVSPRPAELHKMEAYAAEKDFPIIGPACGNLCYQLARLMNAKTVFELGSGYGYSTAWFAKAVQENGGGVVHHVVWDEKLSEMARGHLKELGYSDVVEFHVSEAVAALQKAEGFFDIIFMDIDKEGYPGALATIAEKLRLGGLLIIDNVLWSGRILDESESSPATQAIRETTGMLSSSDQWECSIVPIRDGLLLARKTA